MSEQATKKFKVDDDFGNTSLRKIDGEWKKSNDVPGITEEEYASLQKIGYTNAYHIVGQYLILNMDEDIFKTWLEDVFNKAKIKVDKTSIESICTNVKIWCENSL